MIRNQIFGFILVTLLIMPALSQDRPKDSSVDSCIQQLEHNNSCKVKIDAIQALAKSSNPMATEPMIQALKEGDSRVKKEAALGLGKRDDPEAINPLIEALGDNDSDVHATAKQALAEIGKPAIDQLIQSLQNGNGSIRSGAADALGEIGDSKARMPLLKILSNDKDCNVRLSAAKALKKIGEGGHSFKIVKNSIAWGGLVQKLVIIG